MIWDLRTGKHILPLIGHVNRITGSEFSINGYQLATCGDDNTARIWDIRRKTCSYIIAAHTKLVSDLKFQPEKAKFLATSSFDGNCKIWSTNDWTLRNTISVKETQITSLSFTTDLQYIATTSQDHKWMLWAKKK